MATVTSNASGDWGTGSTWVGGSAPVDGDAVVIAAGHSVKMNVDQSAWAGLLGITIQGSSGTPGMLYFMNGTNGYLKQRMGYTIIGTSGTNKGRILINSDGVWANNGALSSSNKARLQFGSIDATYLNIRAFCAEPTIKKVTVYHNKYTVTVAGSVFTGATIANGTNVCFRSTGTLPAPLQQYVIYKVSSTSGNTFKVSGPMGSSSLFLPEITLTSTGSGTIEVFTPMTSALTMKVLDADLTTDPLWSTADQSVVFFCTLNGISGASYRNISYITAKTSTTVSVYSSIVLVDPLGVLVLTHRNVTFLTYVASTNAIVNLSDGLLNIELRQTNSSGTYVSLPGYQGAAFKEPVNCSIDGIICGYSAAIELSSANPEITASVAGCTYAINTTNSVPAPRNQVFSGNTYGGSTVCRGLDNGSFEGLVFGTMSILVNCINMTVNADFKNIYSVMSNCINCVFNGAVYSAYHIMTICTRCFANVSAHSVCFLYSSFNTDCEITGEAELLLAPIYNTYQTFGLVKSSVAMDNSTLLYHGFIGTIVLQDIDLTFPLRIYTYYNAAITYADSIQVIELYLDNINDSSDYDGLYSPSGTVKRVYAGQYAYVPSTSYDSINDFLMASDLTSQLTSVHTLPILRDLKVWCSAGTRTISIPIVNSFTSLSSGDLTIKATFIGVDGIEKASATCTPSTATDWSQHIDITIDVVRDSFVTIDLVLSKYESGARLFVYPWPVVT